MQIEFVNHASLILKSGEVRLLCDPWLEGRAFNDGWALLSPTKFAYDDFRDITHIWFSHEHPDHFSPACIKRISEEHRAQITVLFQETLDKKVVEFCRQLGFKDVLELPSGARYALAPDFHITC
jgi:L-ascorbate metabolism protein UlaG (beta-lactamase superfamily)